MKKFFTTVSVATLAAFSLAACGGGDDDREAYTKGVADILRPVSPEYDEETLMDFAECITDATYDDISEETRESVINGVDVTTGDDGQTLYDAVLVCDEKFAK